MGRLPTRWAVPTVAALIVWEVVSSSRRKEAKTRITITITTIWVEQITLELTNLLLILDQD